MKGGQQKAMPKQFVSTLIGKLNEHYQSYDLRRDMKANRSVETNRAFAQRQKKYEKVDKLRADSVDNVEDVRKRLVNSLTNWQRDQWARSGYSKKLKIIKQFAEMERGRTA